MAGELTPTTDAALIPEAWKPRYIAALYDPMALAPRCLNVLGDFKGVGDIAHIAYQATAYSAGNVNSDGSFTPTANTLSDLTVTVDKWRYYSIEPTKITQAQSFEDRFRDFPDNAGKMLREDIDAEVAGLYSSVTQTVGNGEGNIGEDELLAAIATLGKNKLGILTSPKEFCFGFHFQQYPSLKRSGMLDYNRTGVAGQGGAAGLNIPALNNIDVVFTNQIAANGTIHENLLFHESAFGWAAQRMPQFEKASGVGARKLTDVLVSWSLMGADLLIAARAVRLRSVTS